MNVKLRVYFTNIKPTMAGYLTAFVGMEVTTVVDVKSFLHAAEKLYTRGLYLRKGVLIAPAAIIKIEEVMETEREQG